MKHKPLPREKRDKSPANGPVSSRKWTEEERKRVSSGKPPKGEKPFMWGSKKS